jgi:nicotinamide mononucleotide transporter
VSALELAANAFNLLSVWFAARNDVHTWWSGMVGCALYACLFVDVKLYADVTLQLFFIASCVIGWWNWKRGASLAASTGTVTAERPITRTAPRTAVAMIVFALLVAAGYGLLLHTLTSAANPFVDSAVLTLSVLAQLLMVARKLETWPVWFAVDCIAVPLYASKGLYLTAAVYAFFLVLVLMGWVRWSRLVGGRAIGVPA